MIGQLKYFYTICIAALLIFIAASCGKKTSPTPVIPVQPVVPVNPATPVSSDVAMWLTNPDQSAVFSKQNVAVNFGTAAAAGTVISVDPGITYQTIDGFGFTLTGGSAAVINKMGDGPKDDLLKDLFANDGTHIGISYLRISIGASDMSASDFAYDDMPAGSTDPTLANFSINAEKTDLIPVLKKIIAIAPSIRILACPWTAPVWMKDNTLGNNGFTGGNLMPVYYDAYARYFVKYIQAMQAEGINIDAITPQNEPLNANNNPAMVMQSAEEAAFVKNNLGPLFKAAGINTKIIVYDHNADNTGYALDIFKDVTANPYVDGSAFHLYNGSINALQGVHDAFPDKNLYFTEQYTPTNGGFGGDLSWHVTNLIVGATRNWCRNVLEWNLATDESFGPHTTGGCSTCKGAVTVSGSSATRNVSYYIIAHAAKFVRPGAVRIASDNAGSMPNVAFKNTDGTKVLIVLNPGSTTQTFNIKYDGKTAPTTLNGGAVATYVW